MVLLCCSPCKFLNLFLCHNIPRKFFLAPSVSVATFHTITVKAAKYRIFFLSEDNEKISNENSYVADSREENAQKRIFRMRFTFKNKKYDKDKQYYLVVYDEESGLEQWRQPVIMDIAFADDFGFGF